MACKDETAGARRRCVEWETELLRRCAEWRTTWENRCTQWETEWHQRCDRWRTETERVCDRWEEERLPPGSEMSVTRNQNSASVSRSGSHCGARAASETAQGVPARISVSD